MCGRSGYDEAGFRLRAGPDRLAPGPERPSCCWERDTVSGLNP